MNLIAALAVFVQLPLSLLRAGKDNPMLVELKNGETYNGILINCDIWYVLPPSLSLSQTLSRSPSLERALNLALY